MATVSVIVLVALTVYIVAGLLALARVPDAGSPGRRLVQLALWPVAVLRNVASPGGRRGRHAQAVAPAVATATTGVALAAPAVHAAPATTATATAPPMLAAAAAPMALEEPAPVAESAPDAPAAAVPAPHDAAAPAAAVAPSAPGPPPPNAVPETPPRDLRGDWERFVLRLTEPSD